MEIEAMKNADRFIGFADTYENARPAMPFYPLKIIMQYLGKKPDTVIDLGCGTGLSTTIWQGNCNKVIGIEPSDDMRKIANAKLTVTGRLFQIGRWKKRFPRNWA